MGRKNRHFRQGKCRSDVQNLAFYKQKLSPNKRSFRKTARDRKIIKALPSYKFASMNVDGVEIDTLWSIQQLLQDKEINVRLIYSYEHRMYNLITLKDLNFAWSLFK